jgi:hypothetical protein
MLFARQACVRAAIISAVGGALTRPGSGLWQKRPATQGKLTAAGAGRDHEASSLLGFGLLVHEAFFFVHNPSSWSWQTGTLAALPRSIVSSAPAKNR